MMRNSLHLLSLLAFMLFPGTNLRSQSQKPPLASDYANKPLWINMMQDPNANFHEVRKAFYTYWEGRQAGRGTGYKPFKRWEYYWQSRVNPDGSFPAPDNTYREYNKYIQSQPAVPGLKSGQPVWTELGPKTRVNYGGYVGVGRVNAIAFHPADTATVYVGAPKGGLWITNNGGASWRTVTDSLPTLGVSAILIDPAAPDHILIGTGDRDGGNSSGMGVFRSIDGGTSWTPFNTGMGNVTVGMFAQPADSLSVILAASNGGLFKTTNGGENWTRTSPDQSNFRDIRFRPGSGTIVYASSEKGFYRSENCGNTWLLVPDSMGYAKDGRLVIGVTPANPDLVYLVGGADQFQGCFLSRDNGKTFTTMSTSPNILGYAYEGDDKKSQAWYDLMIHVDPVNPQLVFVGGINIWKSADEGKTWQITAHWWGDRTNEVHADQHTFAFNPLNSRLYAGNDGGVYYSDNQGGKWKEISEGLGIGQLYKLGVSNTNAKRMTGGFQDNGSATWTGSNWLNAGGGDGMECAVDPFDARYTYTTLYYGEITRYFNDGDGRTVAGKDKFGINEDGGWVTPFVISEFNGNTMVVGFKNIWISRNVKSNNPITWTKISDNLAGRNDVNMALLEASPADPNLLFAAREDGKLFRTDSLLSPTVIWTELTSKLPVSGTPSDLECNPFDPNTVYMALNRKIYKSVNKGISWENISGTLPSISINSIAYDKSSPEGLYIGTDAGIYYKDASMTDWILYGRSFPVSVGASEVEIYHDIRNRSASRLRASTFGRGVWEIGLAETTALLPPAMLSATLSDNVAELTWIPPFYEQDVTEYVVYRNGALLARVNGNTYYDSALEPDVTYTYKVTAVYEGAGESASTNEAYATIVTEIELPYSQAFEKGTGGWKAKYTLEGWKYGTAATLGVTGRDGHFFAAASSQAGTGVTVKDYLFTPEIDLSAYKGRTVTLNFAYTMRRYRTYDKFSAVYRVSPDSAWVKLSDINPPSKNDWVWDTTAINLPDKALTQKMQIGFFYDNSNQFAWGAAVDDVELFLNTTSAHQPSDFFNVKAFPNPSDGRFSVELASQTTGEIRISVVSLGGQTVYEKTVERAPGALVHPIDISNQPAGIYQLVVRSGLSEWREKITVR